MSTSVDKSKRAETSAASGEKRLSVSDIYLIVYNLASAVGWLLILLVTQKTIVTWKTNADVMVSRNLYANVETYLLIFQTAALLEVFHAAVGLVRSNPVLVFLQVLSRLLVVWAVAYPFTASRNSIGLLVVCIAWPLAEIVRYVYYALNILNKMPYFVVWCRYSFFIVLYPIGVSGELITIYKAIEYLQPASIRKAYGVSLPNKWNISFDLQYFFIFSMIMYIPVFPMLYNHMLVQRKKVLFGANDKKKKQ